VLHTLAVANYRSLRRLVVPLRRCTVVTGPNGSGKSSLYRSVRLLADMGRDGAVNALAREGGLASTMWAGPGRKGPVSLKLGFAGEEFGYAVDLGLPQEVNTFFGLDPEIKAEALWAGPMLRPATLVAETVRLTGPGPRRRRPVAHRVGIAAALRQHGQPGRRPSRRPRVAGAAGQDAVLAFLRPRPHR
jgi:predicted ATPase